MQSAGLWEHMVARGIPSGSFEEASNDRLLDESGWPMSYHLDEPPHRKKRTEERR